MTSVLDINYLTNLKNNINDTYNIKEGKTNNNKTYVQNNSIIGKYIRSDTIPTCTQFPRKPHNKRPRNETNINSITSSMSNILAVNSEIKSQQSIYSYFRSII